MTDMVMCACGWEVPLSGCPHCGATGSELMAYAPLQREEHELSRVRDRRTSKEAAGYIVGQLKDFQWKLMDVFRTRPQWIFKDDLERACKEKYDMGFSTTRTRCSELVELGLIEAVGEMKIGGRGQGHTIWALTQAGADWVARHF